MTVTQEYLDTLLLYYEEEVEGEAYFMQFARAFGDPQHRRKIELLGKVERHAAQAVRPLIDKYKLDPKSTETLFASGQAQALEDKADWGAALEGMNKTYPGYLIDFKNLEALGPIEDQHLLKFLTEHEVAALEFLALEATDPAFSTAPLEAYIATSPDTWQPRTV
ncbi:MAG: hypothetical protein AAF393_10970 [Pseudomonadota bacterium]